MLTNYPQTFALVDCNHFYVSCERAFRPELENKPVAVLSNNDGCIVALSPELKRLGVTRGTPWFKIKHLIKKNDIKIFSSNYALYGDMSLRVMSVLDNYTPDLDIYSIDEAFLNLTGITASDPYRYGKTIRERVHKATGIPVSIGIAPTKTLAKAANRIAKKNGLGVFCIDSEDTRLEVLEKTGVEDIWGIGYRYAVKLKKKNIYNARQLTLLDDERIADEMTIVGLRTVKELRGIPYVPAADSSSSVREDVTEYETSGSHSHKYGLKVSDSYLIERRKSIVSSRSFGKPVINCRELTEAVNSYCITAVRKLRQQKSVAKRITVFLTTNPFKEGEPQYANYREGVLPGYSAYPPDFTKIASAIMHSIYRQGYSYKKVGVMITDIIAQENSPQDIFDTAYVDDRRKEIMNCVDNINNRWGQGTIDFAGAGLNKEWKMRREMLSPRYTTCWKELLTVKA